MVGWREHRLEFLALSDPARSTFYARGHKPLWNCKLLLVCRLMRRATSLIHIFEIKILLNLPSIIFVLTFVNMKTSTMLMLFSEQARGRPTWSLRATGCPRAPRWWPLRYTNCFGASISDFVSISIIITNIQKTLKSNDAGPKYTHIFSKH